MNKTLTRGALMLIINPFVSNLTAQDNTPPVATAGAARLVNLTQDEIDQIHRSHSSFKYQPNDEFSYLQQGSVFVPSFFPKPHDWVLEDKTWKSLCASLTSASQFDTKDKLSTAVNELRARDIRLEFKFHPRLMAFLIANQHLTQKDIDANKDDLIFLLSQENHLLIRKFPSGNTMAHVEQFSTSPDTTPKSFYDQRKQATANEIRKFIDNYYQDSSEKTRLQGVLKKLGFEDYNGFSPMTFMQMAKDYDLVDNPDKFKILLDSLRLDPQKPLKVNFTINILADESADHNACFYSSMINPEKAWESAMKYSAKPLLHKDGSITMVLGVRENKKDLTKLVVRLKEFFDQVRVDASNLQINIMAHGSFDETTKKGAIHLSSKDDEADRTLSDSDLELYKSIGKAFPGPEKCHLNFMTCYGGKDIARVISQELLNGLQESNSLQEFSFSAPYESGYFSSEVSQEGLTQYDDSGVSSFRFKNYYPSKGTVEYRKKF